MIGLWLGLVTIRNGAGDFGCNGEWLLCLVLCEHIQKTLNATVLLI